MRRSGRLTDRRFYRRWLRRLLRQILLCLDISGPRLIDGPLESLDRFADPFTQLREFTRPEDNQDDNEDEEQLHPSE